MNPNHEKVIALYDGTRTSRHVAELTGLSPRYVRRIAQRYDLARLSVGAQPGEDNHQFVSGRRIDLDGYVLVTAPEDHPHARQRTHRAGKLMFEHRLVMEQKLGRYLQPMEVVDHIDGLTLHNAPDNLRVFPTNGDHLHATLAGRAKHISPEGRRNIGARTDRGATVERIDSYHQRKALGEIRLRQMLLAWLSLDTDSPYLLGTHRHLEKAQIDGSSRSSLERALADLYTKWGWPPPP